MTLPFARQLAGIAAAGVLFAATFAASAQESVKIGFVGPYTGPFAVAGQAFRQGGEAYMALHGDKAGGHKGEVIYRGSAGPDPTLAKRLAEEVGGKDKGAMPGGLYLRPEVAATATG